MYEATCIHFLVYQYLGTMLALVPIILRIFFRFFLFQFIIQWFSVCMRSRQNSKYTRRTSQQKRYVLVCTYIFAESVARTTYICRYLLWSYVMITVYNTLYFVFTVSMCGISAYIPFRILSVACSRFCVCVHAVVVYRHLLLVSFSFYVFVLFYSFLSSSYFSSSLPIFPYF